MHAIHKNEHFLAANISYGLDILAELLQMSTELDWQDGYLLAHKNI
jgi:hypothetical protein